MTGSPRTDFGGLHEKLRSLAVNARTEQATWWLWDDERDYGPMLAFGHAANPEAITDLCDEIERLRNLLAEIAKEAGDHMQPYTLKDDGLRRVRDKALYELTPDPNVQIEILRTGEAPV